LEFNVPFQHKYGYMRDENWHVVGHRTSKYGRRAHPECRGVMASLCMTSKSLIFSRV